MATFVERVSRRFEEVAATEEGICTSEFLDAARGVVLLFDELGSAAFLAVKSDISGNIDKVQAKYDSDKDAFNTLEKIILAEAGTKDRKATQGLLWLKRGLEFTALGLRRNLQNASEELADSFRQAYELTLRPLHGLVVRIAFNAAMAVCPYRKTFYEKLGGNNDAVYEGLEKWVVALQGHLDRLNVFYKSGAYDKGL
ncbi:hypothetical protein GGI04_000579 [Coemansia thaxteri]|uniref:Glycolipid transfer protein domain-containing protein n=1 Tax=Coemansia thaxteri TaxID=2663907 RepID=A0A9W8EH41_9FUNG|nr:hypothetical protein H4R26_000865 [Coemansia thaxteri]KAJ2009276.1 hypothetical protein GGI04_000579 [Coemansia thaxteri]KAJ2472674.1 hypothetical protein GGI02_001410 [Coemansia sp. RSA 2322]KAJ2487157.1 hypothetical protein EV174_000699 [Coemansia sp. RSA 2320]